MRLLWMRLPDVSFRGDFLWPADRSISWGMNEFFGPVDDVNVDGYVEEEGDILLIELTAISRYNEERVMVISLDLQGAERLHRLVGERIRPKEDERAGGHTGRSNWR